jgi:hypothetical protein
MSFILHILSGLQSMGRSVGDIGRPDALVMSINFRGGMTMKSQLKVHTVTLVLAIATLTALPLFSQESKWNINAEHSSAWIYLGNDSHLQNVGIARVAGAARFNAAEPQKSALEIRAELPEEQTISFKSKRVEARADGTLLVTGEMTLARTLRDVSCTPGEDYYGAQLGEPYVRAITHEVSFIVPQARAADGKSLITAEAVMGIENFPELFATVRQANWQPLLQDESCELPQAGEDYSGARCSGRLLAPVYSAAAISVGEDYRGFESNIPSGKRMKLVLRLELDRQNLG